MLQHQLKVLLTIEERREKKENNFFIDILSLKTPPPTIKNGPSYQPDYTIHEGNNLAIFISPLTFYIHVKTLVSHFLDLLIGGDTRMIEQLFQNNAQSIFQHYSWIQLQNIRQQFLTTKVVLKYIFFSFANDTYF